jgi:hypothetical protein
VRWAVACLLLLATTLAFPAIVDVLDLSRNHSLTGLHLDPSAYPALVQRLDGGSPTGVLLTGDLSALTSRRDELGGRPSSRVTVPLPSFSPGHSEVLQGGQAAFRVDPERLRAFLDGLDLREVRLPRQLARASMTVNSAPGTVTWYTDGHREIEIGQRPPPRVKLSRGADLPLLTEIGLRLSGVDDRTATTLANEVPWERFLLLPFPPGAASYSWSELDGEGVLVATSATTDERLLATTTRDGDVVWVRGELTAAEVTEVGAALRRQIR